jgi:hypothetical protein
MYRAGLISFLTWIVATTAIIVFLYSIMALRMGALFLGFKIYCSSFLLVQAMLYLSSPIL